jgi:hypothetical protein
MKNRREVVRKQNRIVNMVQKLCTHVCKCKNDTCLNCSRNGDGGGVKESSGGEFKYDVFGTL